MLVYLQKFSGFRSGIIMTMSAYIITNLTLSDEMAEKVADNRLVIFGHIKVNCSGALLIYRTINTEDQGKSLRLWLAPLLRVLALK